MSFGGSFHFISLPRENPLHRFPSTSGKMDPASPSERTQRKSAHVLKKPGSSPETDFHLPQRLLSPATRPSDAFKAEAVLVY
jgi:hypothetical protein